MTSKVHAARAALLVSAALYAAPAIAQDTPDPAAQEQAADGGQEGDIIVTGSRLATPNLDSAGPLQVVSARDIESTGSVNLQDVLLDNPVFGTPLLSRTNSGFVTSSAGVASLDLRNLGSDRTLVLVNGRRFVSGVANSVIVDFNTIPAPFIERVDILTGGASSIYGSDAVAGVINIIYKTDFEGVEFNAKAGLSEEGDDTQRQLDLTVGANLGDRGNVTAYAGYSLQGGVYSRDRAITAVDQASTGATITGDLGELFDVTRPFYSGFAPGGQFFSAPGVLAGTFLPNGRFQRCFSTNGGLVVNATASNCPGEAPGTAIGPNGFNRSVYRIIAIPVERYLLATRANYEVTDAVNVFVEGNFSRSHTEAVREPFAIATAGNNGIFQGTGGFFNVEAMVNGNLVRNPFVPDALYDRLTDNTGDGLRDTSFTRRLTDIDVRGEVADRTTYRIVVGAEGEFAPGWHYDVFYNYGHTDDNQTGRGQVNLASFRSALDVVADVTDVDGDGNLTEAICRDPNARSQGCVPANVFGANTISPQAAAYIRADSNRTSFAEETNAGVNISGNPFDPFGAGDMGVAVGGEYRKERSASAYDALSQAGLNGGNAIANTEGQFDVLEGYAEVNLPILAGKPFFDALSLRGAIRVSDYSTVGSVVSYNFGGEWAPIEELRFRVMQARATRAPNVAELYAGPGQTFPVGLIDPCLGVTAAATGTLATTCRSFPGVNANIAANGAFTQNQADVQGVSGFDLSNPNLQEERGDSFTAGVVFSPRWDGFFRNFSLTVDYFDIKVSDAIVDLPRQFILNQCFEEGVQQYCALITRRPGPEGNNSAGSLNFVNAFPQNSGGLKTTGIDVTANWSGNLGSAGTLDLSLAYTHLFDGYLIPLPGEPQDVFAGEIGSPEDKAFVSVRYGIDDITFSFRGTWIGPSYVDDQFVTQFSDDGVNPVDARDPRARIDSEFYGDVQIRALVDEKFEFYVGVDNVFANDAPLIPTNVPGNSTGTETEPGTYDAIGRRFYSGVKLRF